jgi:hypothetical protein
MPARAAGHLRAHLLTLGRLGSAGVVLAALLTGCQPLPHPFAEDGPPAALLAVPNNIDISVGSLEGEPRETANKLAPAIAQALLKHNIPATAQTTSHGSYQLDGRIEVRPDTAGKSQVTVFWRLRDASGAVVNEHSDKLVAPTRDWNEGSDEPITQLAAASADGFAALLVGEAPKEAPGGGRTRVAIRKIAGAPGDGNNSLASSLTTLLQHRDLEIVDPANGKPQLDVDGEITVDPIKEGKQHVKIVWRVSRAGGGEIGTVAQENDVPRGRLDGPWGDVAYSVAMAAEGGVMQLIDHGVPPHKLGAEDTASAAPPSLADTVGAPSVPVASSPLGAGTLSGVPGSMKLPAPGNIASPEVNLPPVNVTPQPITMPTPLPPPDVPVILPYRGVPIPH